MTRVDRCGKVSQVRTIGQPSLLRLLRASLLPLSLLPLLWAQPALAQRKEPTPEADAERDQLIDKITRGVELDESVRRFKQLVEERDRRVATSQAAVDRERQKQDARRAWHAAYEKTVDHEVQRRCTLAADPTNPPPSDEGRARADWGRVIKKDQLRLLPKNELDEGEPATLYEVAGLKRHYLLYGEEVGRSRARPLLAEKGDLVLVCDGGAEHERRLPAPWSSQEVQRSGFAAVIKAPPLIAKKKKWNPIHITESRFYWAVREVKWKYPPDSFVLSNIELTEDMGGGRWRIDASQKLDWLLEVPPGLAHQDLLVAGHSLWVIAGHARFDKGWKKLVLVAEDLEDKLVLGAD